MTKWIMKFEVETNATFIIETKEIVVRNTRDNYEAYIQNNNDRKEIGRSFIYVYIIFDSENINTAEKAGMKNLEDFVDILSFSSCGFFEIKRSIALYDWTPNRNLRKGRVYKSIPDPNSPHFKLNAEFVATLETLLKSEKSEPLIRALRWFRFGVSTTDPYEQFQLFWFVIEALTQVDNDKQEVADRCSRCHEPLYCQKCNKISYHRPYPIQAIEKLFNKYSFKNHDRDFTICSKTRNTLLHGESIKNIEVEFGTTFPDIVTIVGKIAWVALLNCILIKQSDTNKILELNLYQPTNFSFYVLDACANVTASTSENINLTISDFPDIRIDIVEN